MKGRIKSLAKELKAESWAMQREFAEPNFEIFQELGFTELPTTGSPPPVEIEGAGSADYFVRGAVGWEIIRIAVQPIGPVPPVDCKVNISQKSSNSSRGSEGFFGERHPYHGLLLLVGDRTLTFDVTKKPGEPRFTVKGVVEPLDPGPSKQAEPAAENDDQVNRTGCSGLPAIAQSMRLPIAPWAPTPRR